MVVLQKEILFRIELHDRLTSHAFETKQFKLLRQKSQKEIKHQLKPFLLSFIKDNGFELFIRDSYLIYLTHKYDIYYGMCVLLLRNAILKFNVTLRPTLFMLIYNLS